jgi:cell wall assembly regulator SMI1
LDISAYSLPLVSVHTPESTISEWTPWNKVTQEDEIKDAKSTPDKGVKDDWWHPLWIPITYDGSGNNICMDLAPATGGTRGQMITMWRDSGYRNIVANSFEEWISNYIASLENGERVFAPKWGIVKRDSV